MPRAIQRDAIYRRRRFKSEDIELCVRWYITYRLSYRDLVAMMAERGVIVTHTTIMRWVIHFVPEYIQRWERWAKPVGRSWRVDETYISVRGGRYYLHRAVDKSGKTVGSMLSDARTIPAAQAFFRRAVRAAGSGWPEKINLDKYYASHRALQLLGREDARWQAVLVRDRRYLNNVVEQDHRAVKQRCAPMLGFKSADQAAVTLAGIELAHRIRKRQFQVSPAGAASRGTVRSLKEQWADALAPSNPAMTSTQALYPLTHQNSVVPICPRIARHVDSPRRFPRKVSVGRGLYLKHLPNGSRYWRYKYHFGGKERVLALGVCPDVTAEMARTMHIAARRLLAVGLDPIRYKQDVQSAAWSAARAA